MSTPWPGTLDQLREAGYSYQEQGKCLAPTCDKEIFWFITPKGKWMPFEAEEKQVVDHSQPSHVGKAVIYQPHFATCPEARKFSRKSKEHAERRSA